MIVPQGEAEPRVKRPGAEADAAFVEAFLRANPAWLAEHPELYRVLEPPTRVHGDGVTDHMAAMLRVQRERADDVLAAGRASAGLAGRVQDAVLALFRSTDPADCVSGEMPGILAIDAAYLCTEAELPGARALPARHRRTAAERAPGGVPRRAIRRPPAACRGGWSGAA